MIQIKVLSGSKAGDQMVVRRFPFRMGREPGVELVHLPAMRLHDLPGHRQTQSVAIALGGKKRGEEAVYVFLVKERVAAFKAGWRWHQSVQWTNLGILILALALGALMGLKAYLLIQPPVISVAAMLGVWLFYVQHQFDGVYWERRAHWDYYSTAMKGSSFYKLPKILQWFSGNIGFHHIHHLSPRIPNYFLERCHRENPLFEQAKVLRLRESLRTIRYRLWDEERQRLGGVGVAWL